MVNRRELATFLRARRERLQPHEVGLPDGQRRRTPGLRRQEVAQLAGMSVDYYIRIEQGRGPHPSRQVLASLARAFMLSADERTYLFRIAGETTPETPSPNREVPPGVRSLLTALEANPAYVLDAKYDLLAWNDLATHFIGDPAADSGDSNVIRALFTRPHEDPHWDDDGARCFARGCVADLRAAMARYPGDRGITDLVTELLATSSRFAQMWEDHEVEVRGSYRKRIQHPAAGTLEFDCQLLEIPDSDQRLIVYVAGPGSSTEAAFRQLADRVRQPVLSEVTPVRQ